MKYSKDYLSTFNHKLTRRPSSLGSKILVVKGQNRKFVDYNKYRYFTNNSLTSFNKVSND